MNTRRAPNQTSCRPQRQGAGIGLLDALHESRRCQAVRAIDNYRHLLGKAEAGEIRRAIEKFTPERVSVRSLCRVWQPNVLWPSLLLMRRMRAWTQERSTIASQEQPDCPGNKHSERTTNMNTDFSFHKASPQFGGKPHSIDRDARDPTSGRMSVWTTAVIITVLVGFAVLHVIGCTLIATACDQPMIWPTYHTD